MRPRFQFDRSNDNIYPDSTARTVSVSSDFTTGGYPSQTSHDHTTRLEFWNITTMTHGPHAIKFGTRMRDYRDANFTSQNYNGTFEFANYDDYLNMENGLAAGQSYASLFAKGYGPIKEVTRWDRNPLLPTPLTRPCSPRTIGR